MKKIMIITMLVLFSVSGSVFAASGLITDGAEVNDATSGDIIAKLSSSVDLAYNTVATSYAVITKHAKGPKAYGSAAGDTKIYFDDMGADTDIAATDASASDNSVFTAAGWTEM